VTKVRDCSPPPSFSYLFYRWIGQPRQTGFDIYVGDYPYGVGRSLGKRMFYRFPPRQGISGKNITPTQTVQRQHFAAAINLYAEQPYYTPFGAPYGQQGRNIWFARAAGVDMYAINYFVSLQVPFEQSGEPAPWDTKHYLTIYAGQLGDTYATIGSPWLNPGTYRIQMMKTDWRTLELEHPYFIAATIWDYYKIEGSVLQGIIGSTHPLDEWMYCQPDFMYDSVDDAWNGYLNDSDHSFLDVTLTKKGKIFIMYANDYFQRYEHAGHLTAKIEKIA